MSLLRSIIFSILASVLMTALVRRLPTVAGQAEQPIGRRPRRGGPVIVIVPILTGNSNNRIGWVREEHYHSLLPRRIHRQRKG